MTQRNIIVRPTTPEVDAISRLNITGNVIPQAWYHWFREDGKLQTLSMLILAEIIYWYRAAAVEDDDRLKIIGYRRKFQGDMLQCSLAQLADKLGASKRGVGYALEWLERKGYIRQELREVQSGGKTFNNVRFVAPIAAAIKETLELPEEYEATPIAMSATGYSNDCYTNTENTTETSDHKNHSLEKSRECVSTDGVNLPKEDKECVALKELYPVMLELFVPYRDCMLRQNMALPDEVYASLDASSFMATARGKHGADDIRLVKAILTMLRRFPTGYWPAYDAVQPKVYNGSTLGKNWKELVRLYRANSGEATWILPADEWKKTMGRYADVAR